MSTVSIPIASLVEDLALYPRHAVDESNVSRLSQALQAGATLPPIIICRATKRIVDGWHRVRAHRRVLGAGAVIDAEERDYANEQELFLDAAKLNATHGHRLGRIDEIRIVTRARELEIPDDRIAIALCIDEPRVRKLSVRIARVESGAPGEVGNTETIALKRPAQHLTGQKLTAAQADAHQRAPGVSYLLIARQLKEGVAVGLADLTDDVLVQALRALRVTLDTCLPPET